MPQPKTLDLDLLEWAANDPQKTATAQALIAICQGAIEIARLISMGRLAGNLGAARGGNTQGDVQKELDVRSNDILIEALRGTPVAALASEELEKPLIFDDRLPVVVALDPLDGSSNIDTNVSIGTIFSILPVLQGQPIQAAFLQPGSAQCAAGYVIYGPHTAIAFTTGNGTQIYTLDREKGSFIKSHPPVSIPASANEYAINASNYRHWSDSIRSYIDDCIGGKDGRRGQDANMRWIGSLVADCHRILVRGGVFLYPRDQRKTYENGRLRLTYEANPIAFLIEQSGGKATDGFRRIMDIEPETIHQRTPLIFGSASEVDRICAFKLDPSPESDISPLFANRGLLRS
ncbi:MAG: class 1 fructose-bisphosphatase [Hyphomicrobiaceae bacterium]